VALVFDESQKLNKSLSKFNYTAINHENLTRYQCNLLDNKEVKFMIEKINCDHGRVDMVIDNTDNLEKKNQPENVHNFIHQTSTGILIFIQVSGVI
jgi:hypothetical protein